MGGIQSCSSPPKDTEASTFKGTKAVPYRWWGLHVLSANCKDANGDIYFTKQLNILGIIVVSLVTLLFLWILMKMMHKKQEAFPPLQ